MGPEKVAPAVAWLCHEDCDLTGQVIAAAGGRFGHIFVGETVGWYGQNPTIEDFAALRYVHARLRGGDYHEELDLLPDPVEPRDLLGMLHRAEV